MVVAVLPWIVGSCVGSGRDSSGADTAGVVPAHPTYSVEVRPILDEWCVSCHGETPVDDAPDYFRLDVYATTGEVRGAAAMAEFIAITATSSAGSMPPRGGASPSDVERATLLAWVDDAAPE